MADADGATNTEPTATTLWAARAVWIEASVYMGATVPPTLSVFVLGWERATWTEDILILGGAILFLNAGSGKIGFFDDLEEI
jgi:hypothetical protein